MPQSPGSGRFATLQTSRASRLGRRPRAFFSGDSFLYTSKEKSYPLAVGQRKLWLSHQKKELDSGLRRNDERRVTRWPKDSGSSGSHTQKKELDSGLRRN